MFDKVKEFHEAFGVPVSLTPKLPSEDERVLRQRLLREEIVEYQDGEEADDLVNIAGELADIIYIVCGTALSYGIPLDKVFDAVHNANMAKLDDTGKPVFRDDGKVLKPKDWEPANIGKVLMDHGYTGKED